MLMANFSLNLTSKVPPCPRFEPHFDPLYYISYGVVMTAICLVGLVGNMLNIAVFRSRTISTPLRVCLVVIALSDMFLLITSFAQWSIWSLINLGPIPLLGDHVHWLWFANTCTNVSRNCCVWYQVSLTAVRFFTLRQPFSCQMVQTQKRVRLLLASVLAWSVVLHIPTHFELKVISIPCLNEDQQVGNVQLLLPSGLRKNFFYFLFYRVLVSFILTDLVPNMLLWILSVKMLLIVRRTRLESLTVTTRLHYEMTSAFNKTQGDNDQPLLTEHLQEQNSTNVNRTVYALCGKFVVCYALPLANNIIELSLTAATYKTSKVVEILVVIGNLLVVVCSACSFVIYLACDCSYRRKAKRILSDLCGIDGPSYL